MSGAQQVVAAGGAGLLVLNTIHGPNRKILRDGIFSGDEPSQTQSDDAKKVLIKLGSSLLAVGAATLLAGVSDQWGRVMVTVIVALFVLYAMNRYAPNSLVQVPGLGAGPRSAPAGPTQRHPVTS